MRLLTRKLVSLIVVLLFVCGNANANANANADADAFLIWSAISHQGNFNNKNVLYQLTLEGRSADLLTDYNRYFREVFIRGALGYKINPTVSIFAGFSYFPLLSSNHVEEYRPWQSIIFTKPSQLVTMNFRSMLEQRFRNNYTDVSWRFRQLVGFKGAVPWFNQFYLLGSEELFINLNHADWANENTIDQNRLFIGLERPIGSLDFQFGYLNQLRFGISTTEVIHILVLALKL